VDIFEYFKFPLGVDDGKRAQLLFHGCYGYDSFKLSLGYELMVQFWELANFIWDPGSMRFGYGSFFLFMLSLSLIKLLSLLHLSWRSLMEKLLSRCHGEDCSRFEGS